MSYDNGLIRDVQPLIADLLTHLVAHGGVGDRVDEVAALNSGAGAHLLGPGLHLLLIGAGAEARAQRRSVRALELGTTAPLLLALLAPLLAFLATPLPFLVGLELGLAGLQLAVVADERNGVLDHLVANL